MDNHVNEAKFNNYSNLLLQYNGLHKQGDVEQQSSVLSGNLLLSSYLCDDKFK